MNVHSITPVVLTYNEEANIHRTLEALSWAKEIVVVDSGSTDATLKLIEACPQARCITRSFDRFGAQWNFALTHVHTPWVLCCDADYLVTKELLQEISQIPEDVPFDGYYIPFRYCIEGKPLRGALLPPRCALFLREKAHFTDDGHAEKVILDGTTSSLSAPFWHDDRKPFSRWLKNQFSYMEQEAEKLSQTSFAELTLQDKIRRAILPAPMLVFLYCFLYKRGLLDGRRGLRYAFERTLAESILSYTLLKHLFSKKQQSTQ